MATTFVTERVDIYPNTTVIKVYPRIARHLQQGGAPSAAKVTEATMTSGKAEFTGLTAGAAYTCYAEVSNEDRYLDIAAEAAPPASTTIGNPTPALHGFKAWAYDPVSAVSTNIVVTAGRLLVIRVPVPESIRVSNITMVTTTAGGTLTASENGLGLYDENKKLLAKCEVAATITAWEATAGEQKLALESTVTVGGPGVCFVGLYYKGTTAPTFASAAASKANNVGLSVATGRFSTADTGLTTALPSTIGTMANAEKAIWVGLS